MKLTPFVLILAASVPAVAKPSSSAQAEALFDDAKALMAQKKFAEACDKFDSSQKLDPAITTLINAADCREKNNQLATAWGLFADAGRQARAAKNDKLAKVAANHSKKLEPRLSKLTINVPADRQVAGLVITRSNEPVDPASFNHALPIDGGTYVITARAPGKLAWTTTKTIKTEGDAQSVEVPALAAAPAAPVATAPVKPTSAAKPVQTAQVTGTQPATELHAQAPARRSNVVPIAVGAGALVLGGAAIGFELSGRSKYDDAKKETMDQDRRDSLQDQANTRRYVAEVLGVAAVGAAGVAVYLYVRGRGEHREQTALVPSVASGAAGLALTGRW